MDFIEQEAQPVEKDQPFNHPYRDNDHASQMRDREYLAGKWAEICRGLETGCNQINILLKKETLRYNSIGSDEVEIFIPSAGKSLACQFERETVAICCTLNGTTEMFRPNGANLVCDYSEVVSPEKMAERIMKTATRGLVH
jgi:hypothetical protein